MAALPDLHGRDYKRMTFYFPKGDEVNVGNHLEMPDHRRPGEIRDLHFKYCGHKLKKSVGFDDWVETIPPQYQDRFAKSEKGIDTEICCDALKLASGSRLERLFLFTNDSDFIPLCRAVKEFGANISIIHLAPTATPNNDLIKEADSYDVVPIDRLQEMFLPVPDPTNALLLDGEPVTEKAEEIDEVEIESDKREGTASTLKATISGAPELDLDTVEVDAPAKGTDDSAAPSPGD